MSDVSGIPYMGPMGVGNLFASPYPALSGGGNMSAGQISAPYAGPSAYNQDVLNNLYGGGPNAGFGQQTNYYSQLGASYLAQVPMSWESGGRGGDVFNLPNAGTGLTVPQLQQPWLTPEGGVNNVFSGGGSYQGPAPGLGGGGGFSAYDYGSLFGGGGAATPPSSYNYGSLYNPPAAPDPLSYQTLYSGSGGLFQGGFPNAGGYQMPSSQGLLGYDPNTANLGGGGIGGLGGGWGNAPQPMPNMQRLLGYTPQSQYDFPPPPMQPQPMGYDYGSLYGGGGNSLGGRLAQTLAGGVDPAWPAAQRNAGLVGPVQSALSFDPSGYSRGYGNERGFGGDPNWGGFGQGGANSIGGGVYDPFNVGGAQPLVGTEGAGLGGGRGGGLFQGGFPGAGGTQTPDIQRLLGYTPDLQLGISGLQKTLREIDAATARGDRGLEPGFWERAIPDPGSTLSPQDRQIRFSGSGFRDPSFFGPGGLGGDSGAAYSDSGLPLEITQGGSTPGGAMFSDFNRSLFGNAPAYPSGVVRGPYALPDVGVEGAAAAPGTRGGALPYFGGAPGGLGQPMTSSPYFDEPAAGFGGAFMPPQQQSFEDPAAGFGGAFSRAGNSRFTLPDVTNEERTFPMLDSPNIRDRIALGGIGPASRLYSDADLAPGLRTQQLLKAPYNSTNFNELNQAYLLDQQRARFGQQLQTNPAMLKTVLALAPAEMGKGNTDEAYQAFFESFLNRAAAYSTDLNPSAPKNVTGRAPGLVDLMSDPEILGGSYYEPINKGKMQPHLDSLNNPNDSENFDRLNNILNRVLAGSNVGNLPLGNSSYGGKANPSMGPGSILPRYGGDYGMYFPVPGSAGEYLTSKLNPYNNPQARDFIGAGNQAGNRAWWMNLMPIGSAPWATGGR